MTKWSELDEPFRSIVFRDGVEKTAERIPAARNTVYRLISGETTKPSNAVRAGVERIVEAETQEQ